ncbi:MAG TPA: hypothetical protein VHL30_03330 [Chlamydiales bacterium]|jgi:hypothetical protein|nr:hypothetical protein [Chlamydiales bacterium]
MSVISSLTNLINRHRGEPLSALNQKLKKQGEWITSLNTKIQSMVDPLDPSLNAAQKITHLVTTQRESIAPFAAAVDVEGNFVLSKDNSVIQTISELNTLQAFILENSKTIEAVRALRLKNPSAYESKIQQYPKTREIIDLLTSDKQAINTDDLNTPLRFPKRSQELAVEQLRSPKELAEAYQTAISNREGEGEEAILKKYALLGVKQAEKDYLTFATSQFKRDFPRIRNYSIDGREYYSCPNPEKTTSEEIEKRANLLMKFLVFIWKEQGLSNVEIAEALLACSQASISSIITHCAQNGYEVPKMQGAIGRISVTIDTNQRMIKTSFATPQAMTFDLKTLESVPVDGNFQASHLYHYQSGESSFEVTKFNDQNGEFLIR